MKKPLKQNPERFSKFHPEEPVEISEKPSKFMEWLSSIEMMNESEKRNENRSDCK